MNRPKLLDLFCGEGGAGHGYSLAGYDVFGVDNNPARLARYPYPHHEGNALDYLAEHGHEYDVIHASPPCQGYSRATVALPDRLDRYDRLIAATRDLLEQTGRPWVIENVEHAAPELRSPFLLCGRMFGLSATDMDGTPLVLDRHRLFEVSSVDLLLRLAPPAHPAHDRTLQVAGVYGGARRDKIEARQVRKGGYVPASLDVLKALIGAPWMSETGLFLSIPPAYSEWIGRQLLDAMEAAA
jgi:DNA (cytosine-5)-methyltransferase 1